MSQAMILLKLLKTKNLKCMKYLTVFIGTLFLSNVSLAQIEFKLTKPILKEDWVRMQDFHRNHLINDMEGVVHVQDESGMVHKISGNRPSDPADLVSWRPPVVPPLGYETYKPETGSGTVDSWPATINVKPNPIDPGCPYCSVIIIYGKISNTVMKTLDNMLDPYKQ